MEYLGGYHSFDLPGLQQNTKTKIINTTVVADNSQVLDSALLNSCNQVLRNTAQSKASNEPIKFIRKIRIDIIK